MKPDEALYKIAAALQSIIGERANVELFQDPATNTASLKIERDSEFTAQTILKTSDIRHFPIKLVNLLPNDPEEQTCETSAELDESLAGILTSREMHELLIGIMSGNYSASQRSPMSDTPKNPITEKRKPMIRRLEKLAILLACICSHVAIATPPKPNILWITCEDMSANLGCYGDAAARTPYLDKFANESARFTRAFTVAPVCAPSRSALITGMYPTTIGTQHMRSKVTLPPEVKCFTEYLRAAGYYCTNNVKTDYNFDSPAAAWDDSSKKAHWRNRPEDAPFFSVINLTVTHEGKFHMQEDEFVKLIADREKSERHDAAKITVPPYLPDTPVVRRDIARYYDMVTEMDRQAGQILKDLDAEGLSSNTVVFFFSDHGSAIPRGKRWLYDSGTHVPLLVRRPGTIEAGSVREDLVSFVDFAPTVLELAGLRATKHMQGKTFLGEAGEAREYVFATRDRMDETVDMMRSVRDSKMLYIRNLQPEKPYAQSIKYADKVPAMQEWRRLNAEGKLNDAQKLFFRETKPKEELYDCIADPHQLRNLADDRNHREDLVRLRAALDAWREDSKDTGDTTDAKL